MIANDLIVFTHVVEAGSLTAAADRLGLPKATVSRRLTGLENALGERLLQRSTRRLSLTEFGQHMLAHAQRLRDASDAANALAQYRQTAPQGVLRASFPPEFHELHLTEVLTRYAQRYPQVRLVLDLSPRRVDLQAERFDLAVRAASRLPDDSSLVARQIIRMYHGLYASPHYLALHGWPQQPTDLLAHTGLALVTSAGELQPWRLTHLHNSDNSAAMPPWEGLPQQVHSANSVGLQQALAAQAMGVVGLSERFAQPLVEEGVLARVLPDWQLPPTVLWCVTPGRDLLPQRTTAFIEVLKEVLC